MACAMIRKKGRDRRQTDKPSPPAL